MTETFDWDRLRIFRQVARLGSMSAAANLLGTSLPTVSRRITELEKELRAELFTRTTAGVVLTDAGEILRAHTDLISHTVAAIHHDLAHLDDLLEGPVSLAVDDALGPYWLAPRLPDLQNQHPGIQIDMSIGNALGPLTSLAADISVQLTRAQQVDTITRRIGTLQYTALATADYLATHGPVASIRDMLVHRVLIHPAYRSAVRGGIRPTKPLTALFETAQFTNSTTAMLATVSQHGGIALLPAFLARMHPDLSQVPIKGLPHLSIWLCYAEPARNLARCKAVIAWLRNCFDPNTAPDFSLSADETSGSRAA